MNLKQTHVDVYLSPMTKKGRSVHKGDPVKVSTVPRAEIKKHLTRLANKHGVEESDFEWYKAGTKL